MKRDERRKFPYYGILPLILTLTANFIAYFGTRPFTSSWKHYNIETVLDQQIPVIPWTIVIYFGCYLVWIVNYLIAASREKEFVWRFFAADVLARLVCMAFYLLLPTTNVRPSIPEQGFWNQMLALLYQMDAAYNLFPSIHCLNSWFCYIAVRGRREIPRCVCLYTDDKAACDCRCDWRSASGRSDVADCGTHASWCLVWHDIGTKEVETPCRVRKK